MKTLVLLTLSTGLSMSLHAQDAAPATSTVAETTKQGELPAQLVEILKKIGASEQDFRASISQRNTRIATFRALDKEKQEEFLKLRKKAEELARKKRIAESLHSALEATHIFEEDTLLLNTLGAAYVELRDFTSAKQTFQQLVDLEPYNGEVLFNLSETNFVSKDYKTALTQLEKARLFSSLNKQMDALLPIIQFKIELCHLALSKDESLEEAKRAEHLTTFTKLVDARSAGDTKLITYYSKAAQAFAKGDEDGGSNWIRQAVYVFANKQAHHPWLDTLREFGYINNLYNAQQKSSDTTKD